MPLRGSQGQYLAESAEDAEEDRKIR